ncbi:hypothetical protein D3C76_1102340 [compost metagenome]
MSKESLSKTLQTMTVSDPSRSETARLRDVFQEIEQALASGVSRKKVLEALHADGFTMTLKSFESALYRIRKQRDQGKGTASAIQNKPTPTLTPAKPKPEPDPRRPRRFTHNPTPPDNILD